MSIPVLCPNGRQRLILVGVKLEVFRPSPGSGGEGRDFVLLEDLGDHFDVSNVHFVRENGVSLTFMRGRNLMRLYYFVLGIDWRRSFGIRIHAECQHYSKRRHVAFHERCSISLALVLVRYGPK